jgi:metal-sulfur cluster biosynthetic enzyme
MTDDPTPSPEIPAGLTEEQVRSVLRRVKDPELNLNIVDLGLIYEVDVSEGKDVHVNMTLTSPGCPSGPEIMGDAQRAIESIEGVGTVDIELVWTPYWTPDRIDPRLRAFLGG